MGGTTYDPDLGRKFGKHDIERLGIFVEMPYMNGTRYVSPHKRLEGRKGPTFLPTGRKTKSGNQDGYFDNEFRRLYEGEGITRRKRFEKSTGIPFVIGARPKKHSTPGDYYGTFDKCEAFSPATRKKPPRGRQEGNFTTKNPKKGGPGYADICINKYPEHEADRYGATKKFKSYGAIMDGPFLSVRHPKPYFEDTPYKESDDGPRGPTYIKKETLRKKFFDGPWTPIGPTKWQGGCHGGCLNPFPLYEPSKYVSMAEANKPIISASGPIFYPTHISDKTMFTTSILNHSTDIRINANNYKTTEPVYIKYLVD